MSVAVATPREAKIGDNLSAEMQAYETHKANLEDLFAEAKNWLDGSPVENQAQHDELERLLDMVRDADDAADASRVKERAPWDKGAAEVQERYNELIGDTKAVQGLATRIRKAALPALTAWRTKVAAEKAAAAEILRLEAQRKADAAAEAIRAASASTDLQAREDAEALLIDAKSTAHAATRAAGGPSGLRTTKVPVLNDAAAALKHYIAVQPERIKALLMDLAREDFRAKKYTIPGFSVDEVKTAF